MAVTFKVEAMAAQCSPDSEKSKRMRTYNPDAYKAVPPSAPLTVSQLLRIKNLQAIYNASHATIRKRSKFGLLPKPDGYDISMGDKGKRGRPYWYSETIREHLEAMKAKDAEANQLRANGSPGP
ncbi:hypothetical protein J2X06_002467 [Lysobacter niastensis]|uniref:Uncharacterized protein n=1 Tax=Lysobacter niastensis TaxID=380629 RepID=A0ABU1WCE0_9GAMM|nr:hypothetical protein [Lysobacter niastensis]MDR7135258.1 hypothetical protein [Lysobacter niastensis]